MSLEKFFKIIDRTWIGSFVAKREEIIEETDPDRIYVENIRSFFHIPTRAARFFCEMAVKEGVFSKSVGYLCPNENHQVIIAEGDHDEDEVITCNVCLLDEKEHYSISVSEMDAIPFYQLVDQ